MELIFTFYHFFRTSHIYVWFVTHQSHYISQSLSHKNVHNQKLYHSHKDFLSLQIIIVLILAIFFSKW